MPPSRSRHSILSARTYGTIRREYSPEFAPAVNRIQKSSKRVRYLRATVGVSNFCKALPFHDIRNQVARVVTMSVWKGEEEVSGVFLRL